MQACKSWQISMSLPVFAVFALLISAEAGAISSFLMDRV